MKLNTCGKIHCGRAVWYVCRHPPTFPRDEAPVLIRCWPELTIWDYSIKLLPGIYPQLVLLPAIYSLLMLSKTDFCFVWMFSATAVKVFFFSQVESFEKMIPVIICVGRVCSSSLPLSSFSFLGTLWLGLIIHPPCASGPLVSSLTMLSPAPGPLQLVQCGFMY